MDRKETLRYASYESGMGRIFIASSDEGITDVFISSGGPEAAFMERFKKRGAPVLDNGYFSKAFKELDRYFAGRPVIFDLPLDLRGTSFEIKVWRAIARIPYGQTRSYGDVASMIRSPLAARAVGGACGANPVPIVIPCHRVIRSGGSLGGYTGGLDIKKALLKIEGVLF